MREPNSWDGATGEEALAEAGEEPENDRCPANDAAVARAPGGESEAHRGLKRLAFAFAHAAGFTICGVEVGIPRSPFRADLLAYRPDRAQVGCTALFECKCARADFLRDAADGPETRTRLAELTRRRDRLEAMIGVHWPTLRFSETLFPDLDPFDGERAARQHDGYGRVRRELARLQRRLAYSTKFDRIHRARLVNLCYLVTEPGVARPEEIPVGWGWLMREGAGLRAMRRPEWVAVAESVRLAALVRLARFATRHAQERMGGRVEGWT